MLCIIDALIVSVSFEWPDEVEEEQVDEIIMRQYKRSAPACSYIELVGH